MKTIHEGRIARTARHIAHRLDTEAEVRLTVPSMYAENKIDRIFAYMERYCGKYYMESSDKWNYIIIRKRVK